MNNEELNKPKKLSLKERLKDKKERAKIELIIYGVFIFGALIFVRLLGYSTNNIKNENESPNSFIYQIVDNYEYSISVAIDDTIYEYYGKALGNNKTINLKSEEETKKYVLMNQKYYVLEDNNYILITEEEVYPYINSRYLNIDNIKKYIMIAVRDGNNYKIKISDLVLGSNSDDYINITIDEGDKSLVIDYTSLLKLNQNNIKKAVVNITYNNIGNIISLEE